MLIELVFSLVDIITMELSTLFVGIVFSILEEILNYAMVYVLYELTIKVHFQLIRQRLKGLVWGLQRKRKLFLMLYPRRKRFNL